MSAQIAGNPKGGESRQRGLKRIIWSDFSDKKELHSTLTSSREHANTVGDRFPQRVRSSWFGPPRTDAKRIAECATKLGGRAALLCQRVEDNA